MEQNALAITVGSVKTIQINRGDIMAGELQDSFAKTHSATKIQILLLNLFATAAQRNDLAELPNSFDRRPTPFIRRSPIGREVFGTGDLGEFFLVSIHSAKLFHPVLDRI